MQNGTVAKIEPAFVRNMILILAITAFLGLVPAQDSDDLDELFTMPFDEFLDLNVVTASKNEENILDAPAIIAVMTADDIRCYASRDLSDVIDRAASTFIYGSYYLPNNMIALRGEVTSHYSTHVLLLLNGRPLRSSKEGYYLPIIRSFPLESIERLEILRGPGSALYGSGAYAGIINIITKKGADQETTGSMAYGSFGTSMSSLSTGYEKGDFSLSAAGHFINSAGWDYEVRGATADSLYPGTNTPAIERSTGFNMMAGYDNFTLNTYIGSNYQMIGQFNQHWWYADEWYLGTTKALADLGYEFDLNGDLTSTINLTYNYLKYWQPFDVHANDMREWGVFRDYIVELQTHYRPSDKFSISAGGLTNTQTGFIKNTEFTSDGTPYNVWIQPENPDPYYVVPKYNETWWSIYGNINFSPLEMLRLTAGAHANKVTNLDLDVVPKLGAVLNLEFPLTLKVLYGQAFRSPDYFELYSEVIGIYGNKFLKPEKISTFEVQAIYTRNKFNLAVNYFSNSQTDVIGRSLVSDSLLIVNGEPQPIFINSEELESHGIEMGGNYQLSNAVNLEFSFLNHFNEDKYGNTNIYGLANTFVKAGLQYSNGKGLDLALFNLWVSEGNEFDVPHPEANPGAEAFNYLTARASANITRLFSLGDMPDVIFDISGFNLLDAGIYYPEYGDKIVNTIPGRPGIAVYGGIRIVF